MTIFLVGYMGSGKSTIGQRLAQILKYNFIDLDTYIETKEDMSIVNMFQSKGEIYFRKVENIYLQEVVKIDNTVVALGGGTPCYGNNMQLILESDNSKSIYLKGSIAILVERLNQQKNSRPMISHLRTEEALREFIGKHLFERSQFYTMSDITITIDIKSVNKIIEELLLKLF